jgi:DNA polymerase-3 subunit beta
MKIKLQLKDLKKTLELYNKKDSNQSLLSIQANKGDNFVKVSNIYRGEINIAINLDAKIEVGGNIYITLLNLQAAIKSIKEKDIEIAVKNDYTISINNSLEINRVADINISDIYVRFDAIEDGEVGSNYIDVGYNELVDKLEKCDFAVSKDDTRYNITGVYFEKIGNKLNLVATDGRILKIENLEIESNNENDMKFTVPLQTCKLLKKLKLKDGNIRINLNDCSDIVSFRNDKIHILTNLIFVEFPRYQAILDRSIQENKKNFQINKEVILNEAKAVLSFIKHNDIYDQHYGIILQFYFLDNELKIKATKDREDAIYAKTIKVDYLKKSNDLPEYLRVGFNAKLLVNILNSFDEDILTIDYQDDLSPFLIRSDKNDGKAIIMPIRI